MLHFCFGASGAGKSTTLYRKVIEESIQSPDTRFFIIVPDQFTMQAQRDVVKLHPRHAIMNIDVLSLSRLRYRIFDELGGPDVPVLDDMGKTLVLRHVAEQIRDELPMFGSRLRQPGFIDEIKSILSEFLQYRITSGDLERLIGVCGLHGQLAARLSEIRRIQIAFGEYLAGHFTTAEETFQILAEKIPDSELLRDSVVVMDGFTGFTPIQYQVLLSILQTARSLTISLVMDPAELTGARGPEDSVFSLTYRTVADLTRLVGKDKISDDIILDGHPVKRLEQNPPLSHLEENLFREQRVFTGETGDSLLLTEAADPAEECAMCCLQIRRALRRDESLTYEQFAVLSTDPETYGPLMEKTAALYGIPVYLDRTGRVEMDPLVECVESALEILRDDYTPAAVLRFMRCPLTGFSREAVDRMQIYLETLGIRGRKRWEDRFLRTVWLHREEKEQSELLTQMNSLRERLTGLIAPMYDSRAGNVRGFSQALEELLRNLGVGEQLANMAVSMQETGQTALAREYEQICPRMLELIDQMVALLGDQTVSVREYLDLLRVGINKISIGMLPASIDRVIVGDMERTRLGEKKIIFFLGVNDTLLPKSDAGGGILNEIDREFLAQAGTGVELAPGPAQKLAYEREYLYLNLTRPSQTLCLSWSLMGMDGRSLRPAELIRRLRSMYPGLAVRQAQQLSLTERAETPANTAVLLSAGMRDFADGRMDSEEAKEYLSVAAELVRTGEEAHAILGELVRAAYRTYQPSSIDKKTADILYGEVMENSVRRLEEFASCPYAHFADYGLRLREEERYLLNPADVGNIYHSALEQFDHALTGHGLDWRSFSSAQAAEFIDEALKGYAEQYRNNILLSNKRYLYMLQRIRRILLRTVDTLQYQIGKGSFMPAFSERSFREQITDSMILKGRIDRLDICVSEGVKYLRVVDYKSGSRKFDPTLLVHGVELQLPLYLAVALREQRRLEPQLEVSPAGMLYYRVQDPMIAGDREKITGDINGMLRKKLAFTGIVNSDPAVLSLMDSDLMTTGASDIIPVKLVKGGSLSANSHVLSGEDIGLAARYVGETVRSLGSRIRGGEIAVSPYRYKKKEPCRFCAYRGVCGFDVQVDGYSFREFREMNENDAMQRIREEIGG